MVTYNVAIALKGLDCKSPPETRKTLLNCTLVYLLGAVAAVAHKGKIFDPPRSSTEIYSCVNRTVPVGV
jgi:hypothetical protein